MVIEKLLFSSAGFQVIGITEITAGCVWPLSSPQGEWPGSGIYVPVNGSHYGRGKHTNLERSIFRFPQNSCLKLKWDAFVTGGGNFILRRGF